MKRNIAFVITLLVFLIVCTGCNTLKTEQTTHIPTNDIDSDIDPALSGETHDDQLYEIDRLGTQYYLRINREFPAFDPTAIEECNLLFDSMESFVDTVTNKKLDDRQLKVIKNLWFSDEYGIKICDFSNLYVPVVPEEFSGSGVSWTGEQYSFSLYGSNGETARVDMCTPQIFENSFAYEYEEFFTRKNITLVSTEEKGNQTEYFYTTPVASMKKNRFSFAVGSRQYVVQETYCLWHENPKIKVSSTVPSNAVIYISDSENQIYAIVTLLDYSEKDYSLFNVTSYVNGGQK